MNRFTNVCMIGSMKFYDTMLEEETRLTDLGYIVMHAVKSGHDKISDIMKAQYDEAIRIKIKMCDIVYVIDVDGYIGRSTKGEIEYSKHHGKPIYYYSHSYYTSITDKRYDNAILNLTHDTHNDITLVGSRRFINQFTHVYTKLTMNGLIVHMPAIFSFESMEIDRFTSREFHLLDLMHDKKIKKSYAVVVVDGEIGMDSYVGSDTSREIEYAESLGKPIFYTTKNGVNGVIKHIYKFM